MRISVIGCGYLGAVHATAMAQLGHEVIGIDVDAAKIERLAAGSPPFYEPGLAEGLTGATASGRLHFSTEIADAAGARVHFVAVGTPQTDGSNAADLRYVDAAFDSLLPYLAPGDVVVGKSTVPVGTAAGLAKRMTASGSGAIVAWNPEFLREGYAVYDTVSPDRLVYGVPAGEPGERATAALNEVYAQAIEAGTPLVVTDYATAELVKVAANAFLATKISFINAMAEIAEVTGADVTRLADAIGYDPRIGRKFLNAGVGFGGGCLPKDIRAFQARAEQLGRAESVVFLKEVDAINLRRRARVVDVVLDALGAFPETAEGNPVPERAQANPVLERAEGAEAGARTFPSTRSENVPSTGSLDTTALTGALTKPLASHVGKKVAVLGLAFKPHSDDVRDSPALDVAVQLFGRGVRVVATDPEAIPNAKLRHPQLQYSHDIEATLQGADVVVLITEWPQFRDIDPAWAASLVRTPIIIDARNCLDADAWRAADWDYRGLGRP